LWSALEPGRATMALQCATTATMDITHTRARLMATMALVGSPAVSLSVPARGSGEAITAVAATTVGQDTATTVGAATLVVDQPTEDAVVSLEAAQVGADRLEVASEAVLHREASQEVAALAVADAGKFNIPAGSTLHLKRSA
jgi:hypothetical protein